MGMFLRRGTAPHRTRMYDLTIGNKIWLSLNGTPWEWRVVHQGLPSDIYDASCNGTWLLLEKIYEARAWNSTGVNAYESSDIHSYLNDTFFGLFDSSIQSVIREARIPYRQGGGTDGTDQSGANGLLTKIFLLSGREVGFTTSSKAYSYVDGACLDYFSGTAASDAKRVAYLNGTATIWWLRSPRADNTSRAITVNAVTSATTIGSLGSASITRTGGVRPAIILESDFIVTDDMIVA